MVVHPNKPILFSVQHNLTDVEMAIARFRRIIRGKKFLFIELISEEVKEAFRGELYNSDPKVAAFQKLVFEANKAGLKVIPLDDKKMMTELFAKGFDNVLHDSPPNVEYEVYVKRERLWLNKLEGANASAIVVVNPVHASEIARKMGLPKDNIVGQLWEKPEFRALAEEKARRIEAERTERKRRKAQARMRRQNRL